MFKAQDQDQTLSRNLAFEDHQHFSAQHKPKCRIHTQSAYEPFRKVSLNFICSSTNFKSPFFFFQADLRFSNLSLHTLRHPASKEGIFIHLNWRCSELSDLYELCMSLDNFSNLTEFMAVSLPIKR